MASEDADEELLARLGVVAANPSDYERVLLAQVCHALILFKNENENERDSVA